MDHQARPEGLLLASDPTAETADPKLPAFIAPPPGAPAYHGFPVLDEIGVEGFTLGLISDSLSSPSSWGDAFVVAPDGRRAGLVWEVVEDRYFNTLIGPDVKRWGVFGVGVEHGPTPIDEAQLFLAELVRALRPEWERTKRS